ncbi:MAG: oxidoreductase [bacterium]|nr:oxidoreductase [bacterium]
MKAILITNDSGHAAKLTQIEQSQLPDEDVLVQVEYSTLNYKDALAITGNGPVVRSFPMVPGIDLAGKVIESSSPDFTAGDKVLLNGHGVGELHWGGLAQMARIKGDWLTKLPDGFTTRDAMAIGTAGYTAMLCVMALESHGITPASGDILVTGATGGVGSVAIALLSKLGHSITASTGRVDAETDYLKALGATTIIDRFELSEAGRPLQKERWAAAIDVAGSHTLANICASIKYGGVVAACGLAQGFDFPSSVMPFILRGVTLRGVDSVYAPTAARLEAWSRLAHDLDMTKLQSMIREIGLDEVIPAANDLLTGKIRGRILVNVSG